MNIKQHDIDNGFIGGIINAFTASMWIMTVFTPINLFMIGKIYIKEFYGYEINTLTAILIGIPIFALWVWFDFSFLYKSRLRQGNRQIMIADKEHPMMKKLERIESELAILKELYEKK